MFSILWLLHQDSFAATIITSRKAKKIVAGKRSTIRRKILSESSINHESKQASIASDQLNQAPVASDQLNQAPIFNNQSAENMTSLSNPVLNLNQSSSLISADGNTTSTTHNRFEFDGIQYSSYYLTSADNPGSSIISKVLDGTNYNTWNIAISIALEAKNKLGFVDGSLPRPAENDSLFKIWYRCNNMVKSWILNSVFKEIYSSILRLRDSAEIWKDLMSRFHVTNLPRSYQLSQQGGMDLSTYYMKLKTLWDDLDGTDCLKTCSHCECCKTTQIKQDRSKVTKFLAGLNDSYSNIRSQIIMKKTIPNLLEVYNILDQDHSQRNIHPVQNASVFNISEPFSAPSAAVNASYVNQKPSQRPVCSQCGFIGHTVDKCYKIHGYPPGFKDKSRQAVPKSVVACISLTAQNKGQNQMIGPLQNLRKEQIEGVIAYFNSHLSAPDIKVTLPSTSGGKIKLLMSWIVDSGAYHSCPETPQQNFVVERKHQHILNVARSLMFQANIPLSHWGDCVLTSVFLINNIPTPLLQNRSPYETLTNQQPAYDLFRVFGCLCYNSTSTKQRTKFQPRSKACVFLGYPLGFKGYKVMDLETNSIFISRNVVFHEDIFPFQDENCVLSDFSTLLETGTEDTTVFSTSEPQENCRETTDVRANLSFGPAGNDTKENKEPADSVDVQTKRIPKPPRHLQEYYCNLTKIDVPYPLAAYMSFNDLSEEYKSYLCSVMQFGEPSTFSQEKKFDEWLTAMNEELKSLEDAETWDIVSLPQNKRAIGCKWVYKTKLNADGTLKRYKARVVSKGYTQQPEIDFVDMFSPVPKMTTVKTLLSVAAAKKWSLHQLDISNAFLNGDLTEEIYMSLPPGYTPKSGSVLPLNPVCKLNKSIYGLKQASMQWFLKFSEVLLGLNFRNSQCDHTLFVRNIRGEYIAILVYVDDIIIVLNNDDVVSSLKIVLNYVILVL